MLGRGPDAWDEKAQADQVNIQFGQHWMVDTDDIYGNTALQNQVGDHARDLPPGRLRHPGGGHLGPGLGVGRGPPGPLAWARTRSSTWPTRPAATCSRTPTTWARSWGGARPLLGHLPALLPARRRDPDGSYHRLEIRVKKRPAAGRHRLPPGGLLRAEALPGPPSPGEEPPRLRRHRQRRAPAPARPRRAGGPLPGRRGPGLRAGDHRGRRGEAPGGPRGRRARRRVLRLREQRPRRDAGLLHPDGDPQPQPRRPGDDAADRAQVLRPPDPRARRLPGAGPGAQRPDRPHRRREPAGLGPGLRRGRPPAPAPLLLRAAQPLVPGPGGAVGPARHRDVYPFTVNGSPYVRRPSR
jgi:hypothetical protein